MDLKVKTSVINFVAKVIYHFINSIVKIHSFCLHQLSTYSQSFWNDVCNGSIIK